MGEMAVKGGSSGWTLAHQDVFYEGTYLYMHHKPIVFMFDVIVHLTFFNTSMCVYVRCVCAPMT